MDDKQTDTQLTPKQQQLIASGEELFLRHGIKRVTVEDICQKAEVSRMTFYRYFDNKLALVERVWDNWMAEAGRKLDAVEAQNIPLTARLRIMLEYKLKLTAQMSPEVIDEYLHLPFYEPSRRRWTQRVMQFLANAQQRGEIRPEIRPEFILVIFEKLQELVDDERLTSIYPDYVEFTKEIWNFFYYGILARNDTEEE